MEHQGRWSFVDKHEFTGVNQLPQQSDLKMRVETPFNFAILSANSTEPMKVKHSIADRTSIHRST
jgi:hypothetical protein